MEQNLDEREIKEYLLGTLDDPEKMGQIEKKLLVDDVFAAELTLAEDRLIELYLDGELSEVDSEHFTSHFLAAPQRQRDLRTHQNLRKIAAVSGENAPERTGFNWRQLFAMPALSYALIFIVVIGVGYTAWRIGFGRSGEMAQLNEVYKGERPLNARIAGFDYAKFEGATRGGSREEPPADTGKSAEQQTIELKRKQILQLFDKAVSDDPKRADAAYGLGKAYLAKGEFQSAGKYLEQAAALAPSNAELQSDLGALYVETGRNAPDPERAGFLERAAASLQKAIELNPKLPEPRFNLALCLEMQGKTEEAKQAWRDYLALDPGSQWAGEARRNLQRLEEPKLKL